MLKNKIFNDFISSYAVCSMLYKQLKGMKENDDNYLNTLLSYLRSSKEFIIKFQAIEIELKEMKEELKGIKIALLKNYKEDSIEKIVEYLEQEEKEIIERIKGVQK